MSVSLMLPPSLLLCPHCHTHFLELMDSPTLSQNDTESSLFDVTLFYSSNPLPQNPAPSLLSSLDPSGSFVVPSAKTKLPPSLKPNNYLANTYTTPIGSCRWLELHASCLLCSFRLEEEEEEGGDDVMTKIRMEIIARLTKEDFYGLRIALNHISSCHTLIEEN
ncbi:hypothetical protein JHK82_025053 [Glycine max]|nr:hypothetical protein JHK82_025053 [Glycine max]